MRIIVAVIGAAAFLMATALSAQNAQPTSFSDAIFRFLQTSSLTRDGAKPFHLRATVLETANPLSPYHAEIEEYWASPTRWRRSVVSPSFTQTAVMNGSKYWEDNDGDYYPLWLRNAVRSIFNPVEGEQLVRSTAVIDAPRQMPMG